MHVKYGWLSRCQEPSHRRLTMQPRALLGLGESFWKPPRRYLKTHVESCEFISLRQLACIASRRLGKGLAVLILILLLKGDDDSQPKQCYPTMLHLPVFRTSGDGAMGPSPKMSPVKKKKEIRMCMCELPHTASLSLIAFNLATASSAVAPSGRPCPHRSNTPTPHRCLLIYPSRPHFSLVPKHKHTSLVT